MGKSTLIASVCAELRKADREIGVLSIDPSSPFTQGAVLGDRIRLSDHFLDPGVFIRSMATRGSLGGLAEAALQAALLMDASGKDDILLETVGVGQGEIDIVDHADTVVLALMPGSGDSIQALKAGVMEIPDVIVVNKCEHPLADTMIRRSRPCSRSARRRTGRCPSCAPRRPRGRGSRSWSRPSTRTAHITAAGTLAERRARNLRAEVLGIAAARLRRDLEARAQSDPVGRARPRRQSRDRPPRPRRASCWSHDRPLSGSGQIGGRWRFRCPAGNKGANLIDQPLGRGRAAGSSSG